MRFTAASYMAQNLKSPWKHGSTSTNNQLPPSTRAQATNAQGKHQLQEWCALQPVLHQLEQRAMRLCKGREKGRKVAVVQRAATRLETTRTGFADSGGISIVQVRAVATLAVRQTVLRTQAQQVLGEEALDRKSNWWRASRDSTVPQTHGTALTGSLKLGTARHGTPRSSAAVARRRCTRKQVETALQWKRKHVSERNNKQAERTGDMVSRMRTCATSTRKISAPARKDQRSRHRHQRSDNSKVAGRTSNAIQTRYNGEQRRFRDVAAGRNGQKDRSRRSPRCHTITSQRLRTPC